MKQKRLINVLLRSLGLFTIAILFLTTPPMTSAQRSNVAPTTHAPAAPPANTSESWRLGVTSEGAAAYTAIIGRAVGDVAAFRSHRGATDMYYIFPAPSTQRTVGAAKFYVLDRTGEYDDDATLTLEILDYAGALQHTVSAVEVDVTTVLTSTWMDVTLSVTPADWVIESGEFLAFHFALSGESGGDLDARPIFEVEVK